MFTLLPLAGDVLILKIFHPQDCILTSLPSSWRKWFCTLPINASYNYIYNYFSSDLVKGVILQILIFEYVSSMDRGSRIEAGLVISLSQCHVSPFTFSELPPNISFFTCYTTTEIFTLMIHPVAGTAVQNSSVSIAGNSYYNCCRVTACWIFTSLHFQINIPLSSYHYKLSLWNANVCTVSLLITAIHLSKGERHRLPYSTEPSPSFWADSWGSVFP